MFSRVPVHLAILGCPVMQELIDVDPDAGEDRPEYTTAVGGCTTKTHLKLTQSQALAFRPMSIQLSRAKFTLSAQLNPRLKPAWYPHGKVITNSPSDCCTR